MDFFIRYQGMATAVEVKSVANKKAKSMDSLFQNRGVSHGIKRSPGNVSAEGKIDRFPLYMTMFLA